MFIALVYKTINIKIYKNTIFRIKQHPILVIKRSITLRKNLKNHFLLSNTNSCFSDCLKKTKRQKNDWLFHPKIIRNVQLDEFVTFYKKPRKSIFIPISSLSENNKMTSRPATGFRFNKFPYIDSNFYYRFGININDVNSQYVGESDFGFSGERYILRWFRPDDYWGPAIEYQEPELNIDILKLNFNIKTEFRFSIYLSFFQNMFMLYHNNYNYLQLVYFNKPHVSYYRHYFFEWFIQHILYREDGIRNKNLPDTVLLCVNLFHICEQVDNIYLPDPEIEERDISIGSPDIPLPQYLIKIDLAVQALEQQQADRRQRIADRKKIFTFNLIKTQSIYFTNYDHFLGTFDFLKDATLCGSLYLLLLSNDFKFLMGQGIQDQIQFKNELHEELEYLKFKYSKIINSLKCIQLYEFLKKKLIYYFNKKKIF